MKNSQPVAQSNGNVAPEIFPGLEEQAVVALGRVLLNSIRGFNMSCQIVVQSLSQWQEKYPGKEWENQLATFDQTLYMGANDWTTADYISKKCGKVPYSQCCSIRPGRS